jgi:hypothetical protein
VQYSLPVFVGFSSPLPVARVVYGTHVDYSAGPIDNLRFAGGAGHLGIVAPLFGAVALGNAASQPATLSNTGYLPLTLGTLPLPDAPFSVDADACSGTTLAPGAQCSVQFRFAPLFESDFAQPLAVPSDDPAGPAELVLHATGVAGGAFAQRGVHAGGGR